MGINGQRLLETLVKLLADQEGVQIEFKLEGVKEE